MHDLATRVHDYELRSPLVPGLAVRVQVEPAGERSDGDARIATYRRTLSVWRDAALAQRVEATTQVDLAHRRFVANDALGTSVIARDAVSLPETAVVGESGEAFVAEPVARNAIGGGAPHRITWSLAPRGDRALWCLHVQPAAGVGSGAAGGQANAECYVITDDGTIVGAVLQIPRPPAGTPGMPAAAAASMASAASAASGTIELVSPQA